MVILEVTAPIKLVFAVYQYIADMKLFLFDLARRF